MNSVLFLVWFNNFALTTGFDLLELHALGIHRCKDANAHFLLWAQSYLDYLEQAGTYIYMYHNAQKFHGSIIS